MSEKKQHDPTSKKLKDGRKDGKVIRAPMFSQSLSMVTVFISIILTSRYLWLKNRMLLQYNLGAHSPDLTSALYDVFISMLILSVVPLFVAALTGVVVQGLVGGFIFEWASLVPKSSRFGQGLKQIFRGLKQSWETFAKLLIFAVITYWLLKSFVYRFENFLTLDSLQVIEEMKSEILRVCSYLFFAFFAISGFEYILKYKEFFKDLSMSEQDVRQEHKNDEGDPQMRSARKAIHQEILSQEMVDRVRKARVIIVKRAKPANNVSRAVT